jgi:hypothetical protein
VADLAGGNGGAGEERVMSQISDEPLPEAIVRSGYMGNEDDWCYWDAEYPDEGSCGPFSTRKEAVAAAEEAGYLVADDGALDMPKVPR